MAGTRLSDGDDTNARALPLRRLNHGGHRRARGRRIRRAVYFILLWCILWWFVVCVVV